MEYITITVRDNDGNLIRTVCRAIRYYSYATRELGVCLYVHKTGGKYKWAVTEARSGFAVGQGQTREEATKQAEARMFEVTREEMEGYIQAAVEKLKGVTKCLKESQNENYIYNIIL